MKTNIIYFRGVLTSYKTKEIITIEKPETSIGARKISNDENEGQPGMMTARSCHLRKK